MKLCYPQCLVCIIYLSLLREGVEPTTVSWDWWSERIELGRSFIPSALREEGGTVSPSAKHLYNVAHHYYDKLISK